MTVDGMPVKGNLVPVFEDCAVHDVEVMLG